MSSFCAQTCVVCDIDGFRGRNSSTNPGEAPDGFCTFTVHNGQWIAFIAGSENLRIRLDVDNCLDGVGLEVAIYAGRDCNNFRQISNCRGGIDPVVGGTSGTFAVTEPLVVGQYYYLVMDGNRGDICDWTFTVLEGSTQLPPLAESGPLEGSTVVCPGVAQSYYTQLPLGATEVEWSLDGEVVGTEDSLSLTFDEEGSFELCMTAFNVCSAAPPTCRQITSRNVVATELQEVVCGTKCLAVYDTVLCETGVYRFPFSTADGCDSLVVLDLTFVPADSDTITATICRGDSLAVEGVFYDAAGTFVNELTNRFGCDSTLTLNLSLVDCQLESNMSVEAVSCFGENDGVLRFDATVGTPPFQYRYYRLGGGVDESGTLAQLGEPVVVNGLSSGTYLVEIRDFLDNGVVLVDEIGEPSPMEVRLQSSEANGFAASCFAATDASISTQVSGGTEPYGYNWNTGAVSEGMTGLAAGEYTVRVTDGNGCRSEPVSITLNEPPPLRMEARYIDSGCDGPEGGKIEVVSTSGGVGEYRFSVNEAGFDTSRVYQGLSNGLYQLRMTDANGCTVDTSATLRQLEVPTLELEAVVTVNLGDPLTLNLGIDIIPALIRWSPADALSCADCPNPSLLALRSETFRVSVTSLDGCVSTDSVRVSVVPQRFLYVPNAFSPNADGVNDIFRLYPGSDTETVVNWSVYDRWGRQVYVGHGGDTGWDGVVDGRPAANGVYVWRARLRFIDGIEEERSGSVILLP